MYQSHTLSPKLFRTISRDPLSFDKELRTCRYESEEKQKEKLGMYDRIFFIDKKLNPTAIKASQLVLSQLLHYKKESISSLNQWCKFLNNLSSLFWFYLVSQHRNPESCIPQWSLTALFFVISGQLSTSKIPLARLDQKAKIIVVIHPLAIFECNFTSELLLALYFYW